MGWALITLFFITFVGYGMGCLFVPDPGGVCLRNYGMDRFAIGLFVTAIGLLVTKGLIDIKINQ